MRWSEIVLRNNADENASAVRGCFLSSLGVDLENIPEFLLGLSSYYETEGKNYTEGSCRCIRKAGRKQNLLGRQERRTWQR